MEGDYTPPTSVSMENSPNLRIAAMRKSSGGDRRVVEAMRKHSGDRPISAPAAGNRRLSRGGSQKGFGKSTAAYLQEKEEADLAAAQALLQEQEDEGDDDYIDEDEGEDENDEDDDEGQEDDNVDEGDDEDEEEEEDSFEVPDVIPPSRLVIDSPSTSITKHSPHSASLHRPVGIRGVVPPPALPPISGVVTSQGGAVHSSVPPPVVKHLAGAGNK
eukprot:gene30603-37846_t